MRRDLGGGVGLMIRLCRVNRISMNMSNERILEHQPLLRVDRWLEREVSLPRREGGGDAYRSEVPSGQIQ